MGDDLPDINILKKVGLSSSPNDAANEVREVVDYISIKKRWWGMCKRYYRTSFNNSKKLDRKWVVGKKNIQ